MSAEKRIRIQTLLLRTFLPVIVVAAVLLAAFVYNRLYDTTLRQFDGRLVTASALTGALVDPADHDWLIGEARAGHDTDAAEDDPRYRRNVDPMRHIRARLGLTYIYTQVAGGPEDVLYILDGTEGDEHTPIGSPDSLPRETVAGLRRVQANGSIYVSPVEYQEQWGLLKTAAAPVYGAEGQITGTAGADVNVSVIQVATQNALFQSAMIGVASIIACLLVTLQIVRRVARPIERLTLQALRIAAGDHRPPADLRGPREVGALSASLERLNARVTGELERGEADAATGRLAASAARLLGEYGAGEPVVMLADTPRRRLFWLAAGDGGLAEAMAGRAMTALKAAHTHSVDEWRALADLDQGVLLDVARDRDELHLTGRVSIVVEVDGRALTLVPGEPAALAATTTALCYRGAVVDLGGGGAR